MQNTELHPYAALYSKLRCCNLHEAEYTENNHGLKSEMTAEQAVVQLKLSKPPPTEGQNYQYLQERWEQEHMSSFKDFLRWYSNKDVRPTLEAMEKMTASPHIKNINLL